MLGRYNKQKEEQESRAVSAAEFASALGLTPIVMNEGAELSVQTSAICRPGLFLAGYEKFFAGSRVIVFGSAEMSFAMSLDKAVLAERIDRMFSLGVPCAVVARGIKPPAEFIKAAADHAVPLFTSPEITGQVAAKISDYITRALAEGEKPCCSESKAKDS